MKSILILVICSTNFVDGWFFGMLGCQTGCSSQYSSSQAGWQSNPQPIPAAPPMLRDSYALAPPQYLAPQMYHRPPVYVIPPSPRYPVPPPPQYYPQPYVRPPPVYVTPAPYVRPPPVYVTPAPYVPPPPKCFQNGNGFKCCNKELDKFLDEMVVEMLKPQWQRCNMQRLATQIQHSAQSHFNHSVEAIVASGGMENLSRYRGDLYCKKKSQDGKTVLIYGTAVPYSLDPSETRPLTEEEIKMANYPAEFSDIGTHDGRENYLDS